MNALYAKGNGRDLIRRVPALRKGGVEHRVVDPHTREALPPGVSGEICVRGYNVMQGLHKLEREDTFTPDGFYATGDAGFFDAAGLLHF